MSDVREPDERIVTPEVQVESARSGSRLSRALAPLLKAGRREPARAVGTQIALPGDPALRPDPAPRRKVSPVVLSLIIVVLIPILTAGTYFFAVATDQFAAETRFAVRTLGSEDGGSKDETSSGGFGLGGASLGGQEADIVADYIHSRAIVDDIAKTIDIRAIFRRPEADFVAKLPENASIEDVTAYWKKMVSVYVESISGIVTVEVRAFRRDDALLLANAIVKSSDMLVNQLSNNVRADAMKHAEDEIRRSEALMRGALVDLTTFRNSKGFIDPVKAADQTGKLLLQLMGDKIQIEGQVFVMERTNPDSPGLAAIRARLESVTAQIATLQQQLAGNQNVKDNLASSISRFEELELKRQFAERMYGFARDGVDRARLLAERKSVYLAVFVPPSLPEDYSYPLRFSDFALIAMAAMLAWSCGATIWASVLDHRL